MTLNCNYLSSVDKYKSAIVWFIRIIRSVRSVMWRVIWMKIINVKLNQSPPLLTVSNTALMIFVRNVNLIITKKVIRVVFQSLLFNSVQNMMELVI